MLNKFLNSRAKHLALLSIMLTNLSLDAQVFRDIGLFEEPQKKVIAKGDSLQFYCTSSNHGTLFDNNITLFSVLLDSELDYIEQNQITITGFKNSITFQEMYSYIGGEGKCIVLGKNTSKKGSISTLPGLDNLNTLQVATISNDSLILGKSLLPDSTYGVKFFGADKIGSEMHLFASFAIGQQDSTLGFYKITLRNDSIVEVLPITNQAVVTYAGFIDTVEVSPLSKPVYVPSFGWIATILMRYEPHGINTGVAVYNTNMDSIIHFSTLYIEPSQDFLTLHVGVKNDSIAMIAATGDSIGSQTTLDMSTILMVHKYNYQQNAVLDTIYLKPPFFEDQNIYYGGFTSAFYDSSFVISAYKKNNERSQHMEDIMLLELDYDVNIINSVILRDTSFFSMVGGFGHVVKNKADEILYFGAVRNAQFASYGSNVTFWGKLGARNIGFSEYIATDDTDMELYPNPAGDWVNLSLPEKVSGKIEVHDLTGRIFKTFEAPITKVFVGDLPAGTYVISIQSDNLVANTCLIKR